MDRAELQAAQKPLKDRYREEPAAAFITLRADGMLDEEQIACKVETGTETIWVAGLTSGAPRPVARWAFTDSP